MKRVGKIVVACLMVLFLVVAALPQGVMAAPKGYGSGKGPKIKFKDIEKSWAKDYITQMTAVGILKGVSDDRFAPDEAVESAQVLVMLVRALGLEDEALSFADDDLDEDYLENVAAWAKGYARVAVEKGLVTRQELSQWERGQKATRLDVARYLAKLLGGEPDEDEISLDSLRFKDLAGVPAYLRVYILLVSQAGLMTGDNLGNWMPQGLINRGQMAKILCLITSRLAPSLEQVRQEVSGEIVRVKFIDDDDSAEITVDTVRGEVTYVVDEDCAIYVDGEEAELEDLAEGQRVRLVLERLSSGEVQVVYVRAENQEEEEVEAEGTISALTLGSDASITVRREGGSEITFLVDDDTVITLAGREVFLSDLERGQEVVVEGYREGSKLVAVEIMAEAEEQEVTGRVTSIVTSGRPAISLEDRRGIRYTFRVTARTRLRLNGEAAVLEDLKPGDDAEVQALGDEALRIEASRPEPEEEEVEGKIAALVLGRDPSLSLRTTAGRVYTYKVTDDTRITLDGKSATLDELGTGWEVELTVKGDEALQIDATSPEPEETEIEGELVQLRLGSSNSLVVEDEEGRQREFRMANNVRVRLDGQEGTLWQLEIGMEVQLTVRAGVVYDIEAEVD